jgi:hypothetical protein
MKAIRLLASWREDLPVIYTTGERRPDKGGAGSWVGKNRRAHERIRADTVLNASRTITA